ncbi:hypothetical protein ANCDUO_08289 [Ancylostoma duodenale]|uniref:Uncharacterized protein n=1 Tax=Ancylostoma duodenale TaxID=51022 RepID=A0A0C2GQS4_9BILA|nr:hypothetical protein ANCDUO_08289 [Ancylostoma duodenale]
MTMGKASSRRAPVEGIDKFINIVTMMLWKAVIPVALLFSLISYVNFGTTVTEADDMKMLVLLLLPIPICAIYKFLYYYYNKMNCWRIFMPDAELWGPRAMGHQSLLVMG